MAFAVTAKGEMPVGPGSWKDARMHRAKAVRSYWPQLPTFRVVAETQSMTKAAARLGTSPSAISRAIAQLEASLGKTLFHRYGKRLALAPAGEALLLGVRTAMRTVDDSSSALNKSELGGALIIATNEPWTTLLLAPTIAALLSRFPSAVPTVVRVAEDKVPTALLRGTIDVAIVRSFALRAQLVASPIASFETAVYRGSAGDHAENGFIELSPRAGRWTPWPYDQPRQITAYADDYDTMIHAMRSGTFRAVLPRALGDRHPELKRETSPATARLSLHVLCRIPNQSDGLPQAFRDVAIEVAREMRRP
jgi:DNA-binding transcriptional LysR family regulator